MSKVQLINYIESFVNASVAQWIKWKLTLSSHSAFSYFDQLMLNNWFDLTNLYSSLFISRFRSLLYPLFCIMLPVWPLFTNCHKWDLPFFIFYSPQLPNSWCCFSIAISQDAAAAVVSQNCRVICVAAAASAWPVRSLLSACLPIAENDYNFIIFCDAIWWLHRAVQFVCDTR